MIIQLLLNVNTRKQKRRRFQKSSFSFGENKSKEFRMRITLGMRNFSKMLDTRTLNLLETYSGFNPSALNIQKFLDFGRTASEEDSFKFLREEIPVRLSNIMKEINLLPGNLLHMPSVFTLQDWYSQSFRDLMEFDKDKLPDSDVDAEDLANFCQTLKTIQARHTNVVQMMAQGVLELKDSHQVDNQTDMAIQYFLDRFYMNRISLRMLLHQHIMLFEPDADKDTNVIGMINPNCKVKGVINEAFQAATILCEDYYDRAPEIDIKGQTLIKNAAGKKVPLSLCYPPSHLYHILYELFKNSMRATVEKHGKCSGDLPEIEVLVAKGEHDVSIRISDQGGGIPRHITDHMFQYLYSTAPRPSMSPTKAPLAGYGYGLPLSRLYARYFHGDLILNSYDGYGTDAVVYLKALTNDATELLPVFNKSSTKKYKAAIPTADWTDPTFCGQNRGFTPSGSSPSSGKKKIQGTSG